VCSRFAGFDNRNANSASHFEVCFYIFTNLISSKSTKINQQNPSAINDNQQSPVTSHVTFYAMTKSKHILFCFNITKKIQPLTETGSYHR
jgi:hypothetical protein